MAEQSILLVCTKTGARGGQPWIIEFPLIPLGITLDPFGIKWGPEGLQWGPVGPRGGPVMPFRCAFGD